MGLYVEIRKRLGSFSLDVNFTVEEGVFALLGASGCGKSMTLKCIAGIEKPDEGRIVLDGKILFDSGRKINLPPQKRNVGYMFQDYALFPGMTVEKNILAGMGRNVDRKFLRELVDRFELKGLEERYPDQLSGGQKQRTALARMLAARPEVILLDEPFAALDSYLKSTLEQQMIRTLKEAGKPAIFVSHNRDEVFRICDKVSCMNQGRTEPAESVDDFFRQPGTVSAAVLSGCKNISRIERLDEKRFRAVKWNLEFACGQIPEETVAIGIRAHHFEPAEAGEDVSNLIPVQFCQMIEDPFEWTILFRADEAGEPLQWKISKKEFAARGKKIPEYLSLEGEHILFLKE